MVSVEWTLSANLKTVILEVTSRSLRCFICFTSISSPQSSQNVRLEIISPASFGHGFSTILPSSSPAWLGTSTAILLQQRYQALQINFSNLTSVFSAAMAYLSKLARATGFTSTATKQCDGSPVRSASPANSITQTDHTPETPATPITRWLMSSTPAVPVKYPALHKVKGARVTKTRCDKKKKQKRKSFWGLPFISSLFDQSNNAESEDPESDVEGDFESDPDSDLESDLASSVERDIEGDFESDLDGDTVFDDEDVMDTTEVDNDRTLTDSKRYQELQDKDAGTILRYRHYQDYEDPALAEWTAEERWFLARLENRGREPLINRTWCLDFTWMPRLAFAYNPEEAFIQPIHLTMYRGKFVFPLFTNWLFDVRRFANSLASSAIKALHGLWKAGPLTRGQIAGGAQQEKAIYRAICDYYKWTLADGKLEHKAHIPVTAIVCAKPKESTESVVNRVTAQLHELGRRYRDKWRSPNSKESDTHQSFTHSMPTLFGFLVKNTVSAIVTVDSSIPEKPIRTMHTGNWNVVNQEGWHVMAIAIAFVRQRSFLLQLDAEGELGPEIIDTGDDPDA